MTSDSLGRESQVDSPSRGLVVERRQERTLMPSLRDSQHLATRSLGLASQAAACRHFVTTQDTERRIHRANLQTVAQL